jgi:hypothetical protein
MGLGARMLTAIAIVLAMAVAVLTLPLTAAVMAGRFLRFTAFRLRHRTRRYLVSTRRNGWYDFVQNNVVAVLPPRTEVLFVGPYGRGRGARPPRVLALAQRAIWGQPKPYLLVVSPWGFRVKPLHAPLRSLRNGSARDPSVQAAIEDVLRLAATPLPSAQLVGGRK